MKTMMLTLTVAAGVLAIPFGALAETAVSEALAERDAIWESAPSDAAINPAWNVSDASMDQFRKDENGVAMTSHTVTPVSIRADNYAAGAVHERADR